ncbi:MAG: GDP-L-fucose synthase [Lentimicrobium sp.]|nr:GDP-L-fucose synthase [Lentimicrobium sp.]
MNKESRIYIAGHRGLVGSAIVRNLEQKGYKNLIVRTHAQVDLIDQHSVASFFQEVKPEYVFLAAAKVGGIMANNTYRAQFIYENLQIQNNLIHQSYLNKVSKLLFLGSSCVYPKNAPQPMHEDCLMSSELEYTNEPYAIAKIAGMKMCESYNLQYGTNFISVMPTNLYGYNDNYHLDNSHVLPALIRKIHLSKCLERGDIDGIRSDIARYGSNKVDGKSSEDEILGYLKLHGISLSEQQGSSQVKLELWGSGKPLREFLWSDDMADACVFLMENLDFKDLKSGFEISGKNEIRNCHINIGTGKEVTIGDLALLIKNIVGFKGELVFDTTKPDGTPRKLLDVSKLESLGWKSKMDLPQGIERIYQQY